MTDNRNTILAVILSGLVLIAWQYFYNAPQMERQRLQSQTQAELNKPPSQTVPGSTTPGSTTPQPGSTPSATTPRIVPSPVEQRHPQVAAILGLRQDHALALRGQTGGNVGAVAALPHVVTGTGAAERVARQRALPADRKASLQGKLVAVQPATRDEAEVELSFR